MKLKTKTILIVITVLLMVFLSVATLNLYHIGKVGSMLEAGVGREGQSLIIATSEALSITLPSRDYSLVEAYGRELVNRTENVKVFSVFDEDGEVVFSHENSKDNLSFDLVKKLKEQKLNISQSIGGDKEFLAPLIFTDMQSGEKIVYGFVKFRLHEAYIKAQLKELIVRLLILFIFIMLLSSGILYVFSSKHIVKPIVELATVTRKLSGKNLNYKIPCSSKDEIGELAKTFNQMIENLSTTTTSVDNLNKEIADRKEVEKQLRESEEKYRKQFEGAMDAIFLANCKTGFLIDCNNAALRLVGREKKEVVGQHQRILHPPEALDEQFSTSFQKHLKDNDGTVLETEVITKTGEIKIVAIKTSVLEIGGKKVLQGIFRDVTESKQKEKELEEAHEDLVLASHRAGMAEVATDVLHNVGNVLNSVNVSVSLIRDKVSKSETENLGKVADMITDHAEDLGTFLAEDPRGKHIPVYLKQATKLLVDEQEGVRTQLQSLTKNVEHIKEIVRTQQIYAKTGGVQISTNLNDVIKDALEINHEGLKKYGIEFKLELAELPTVHTDKQRVLQILVNLINNAKYAISKSENSEKMLTIRCYKHGEDRFRIEVADTQTIHGKTSSKSWGKLKSCSS